MWKDDVINYWHCNCRLCMLLVLDNCENTTRLRAIFEFGTPQFCVKLVKGAQEEDVCVVASHLAAPEGSVRKADRDQ